MVTLFQNVIIIKAVNLDWNVQVERWYINVLGEGTYTVIWQSTASNLKLITRRSSSSKLHLNTSYIVEVFTICFTYLLYRYKLFTYIECEGQMGHCMFLLQCLWLNKRIVHLCFVSLSLKSVRHPWEEYHQIHCMAPDGSRTKRNDYINVSK